MFFTQLYYEILDKKIERLLKNGDPIERLLMNEDPIEEIHRQILELKSMVAMAPELNREVLLRRIREMQEQVEAVMNQMKKEEDRRILAVEERAATLIDEGMEEGE